MSINQMVATNIQSIATNGLVAYLDAGLSASYSGSGSTWVDLVGGDNNGTLQNSPTYSTNNNGYFTFNGTNQWVTLNGSPLNATNYTKCVWFYLNGTADNNLLSYDQATNGHYMFFGSTSTMYCGHSSWPGFPNTFGSVTTFSNSTWYNATLTFNTTDGMTLYINGVYDSAYTTTKTAPVYIGVNVGSYDPAGGNFLNGRVAQALIYNRTLTAAEVRQNFAATRGRFKI